MKRILLAVSLVALLLMAAPTSVGAHAARSLTVIQLHSGGVGVQGHGWGKGPVAVTITEGSWTVGLSLRPNKHGSFKVSANGANLCARPTFDAVDLHGHRKVAQGPPLGCAVPSDLPRPVLHVIVGRSMTPPAVEILNGHPATVTVHVGQVLYLWEPGVTQPTFEAQVVGGTGTTAASSPLVLIDAGQTAPKACAQADCAAGFYWKWLAVRTGDTGIVLSAACRRAKPPCMLPDFIIAVQVVP